MFGPDLYREISRVNSLIAEAYRIENTDERKIALAAITSQYLNYNGLEEPTGVEKNIKIKNLINEALAEVWVHSSEIIQAVDAEIERYKEERGVINTIWERVENTKAENGQEITNSAFINIALAEIQKVSNRVSQLRLLSYLVTARGTESIATAGSSEESESLGSGRGEKNY